MVKRKSEEGNYENEIEIPKKVQRLFFVEEFRRNLHGSDAIRSIKEFSSLAEDKESDADVVMKYLDAGGSIQELVSLLDVTAQADLATAMPIFRVVYLILLRIQSADSRYKADAKEGVESLLSTYIPAIQAMMAINSAKHRKIVFKMLTAIVTLYQSFGREILNWMSLTPSQTTILLEPGPVRKAFVMFLMSYFLEGDANLFKPLIDKKGLLSSVLPGLMYDDATTVTVVLTVLSEKVLKNQNVPKTLKLNVFNTQILQSLFGLYNWIGPRGVQKGYKKPKKLIGADAEVKATVTAALSEFLHILCTSKKHGIVFWDKTLGTGPPLNQLVSTALEVVPKPWENTELSELVVDILLNSPDLIKLYLAKLQQFFEPRDSPSWTEALMFLSKVIGGLDTDAILKDAKESLNQTQLQAGLRGICIPRGIMKHLGEAVVASKTIAVRYHALCPLIVIFRKLNQFLNWLQVHWSWSEKLKKGLMHHFSNVLPNMNEIRHMWRTPRDETPSKLNPTLEESEIYFAISEYLLQVALLDTNLVENPRKISKLLTKDMAMLEDRVKVNVLQAISILDPGFLSPNSALFEEALQSLLVLSCEEETRQDSLSAVVRMLQSTGLFDRNQHELDLWIGAWLSVAKSAQSSIANFLVAIVKRGYNDHVQMETNMDGFDLDEVIKQDSRPSSLIFYIFSALKEDSTRNGSTKHLTAFVRRITVKLLHFYDPCPPLDKAIEENAQQLSKSFISYVTSSDTKILQDEHEKLLCSWLLLETEEDLDLSKFQLDLYQWCSLFYLTLYHLRKSLLSGDFDDLQFRFKHSIELVFNGFSSTGSQNSADFFHKCISSLLKDKILLEKFCVVGKKTLTSTFAPWLKFMLVTLKLADTDGTTGMVDRSLLLPWKHSFLVQLEVSIRKKKPVISPDLEFWMDFLQPTLQELEPLLISMSSLPDDVSYPEGWGDVFRCMIDQIGTKTIPNELLQRLVEALQRGIFAGGGDGFDEALLTILSNFPLSIYHLRTDFLEEVLKQPSLTDSLLLATELLLQLPNKPDQLLDIACKLKGKTYNPFSILALLNRILKHEENSRLQGTQVALSKEIHVFWPLMASGTDLKALRIVISNRLRQALKRLYSLISKPLRRFIRGKNHDVLCRHIEIVRILIRIHMCDAKERIAMKKSLKGGHPQPCLMVEFLEGLKLNKDRDNILMACAKALCDPSTSEMIWPLHADTMLRLTTSKLSSSVWTDFVKTIEFKNCVDVVLSDLSSTTDPHRIRVLNSVISAGWKIGEENKELVNIFHKLTSHDEFLNVLLSTNPVKAQIIELILIIVERCPSVMSLGQVPAFLAAYNATLSICDQQLLQIFRLYEQHCGSLSKFEPLFWGIPAISHYSVRGNVGLSLWRQVTMKSVLQLLDFSKVNKTIADFPIRRSLQRGIEKSCADDLYDPAFLLPLFSNLFSPGAVSYCLTFIHQGALSLTVAALSSRDDKIRAAAAVVISRFYSHLQLVQHSKQKPLWLHVVDCLRYGLQDLEKKPIPSVVSLFLARAILEVAEPLGALHHLNKFFLARSSFNLNTLPEFNQLFFSNDIHHQKHRHWILEVLRDGMRGEIDLNLAVKGPAFKIILTFFESSLSSTEVKITILQVLRKMVTSPKSSQIILGCGFLSWLRRISHHIKGPLREAFLQLVAEVSFAVQKQTRLAHPQFQDRADVVLKQLVSGCNDKNHKPSEEELTRIEEAIYHSSKVSG